MTGTMTGIKMGDYYSGRGGRLTNVCCDKKTMTRKKRRNFELNYNADRESIKPCLLPVNIAASMRVTKIT